MNIYLNFYSGLSIVLLAILSALHKWKKLDRVAKTFFLTMVWYFFTQFITEGGLLYKNISKPYWTLYLIIRDIQPVIEFTLSMLFFHYAIAEFRKKKVALYLIPIGWAIWIICAFLFWEKENFTVYFGPTVCLTNVIMSIISIHILQSKCEYKDLIKLPVFRFVVLFLFFYGFFFFFSASYPLLLENRKAELFAIYIIFRITDIYYVGAGITYFFYTKKTIQIE